MNESKPHKRLFMALTIVLNTILVLFLGELIFPRFTALVLTTLWYVLFIVVVVFISLGAFVLLGMKEEVGHILDSVVEGTLNIFDFLELARKLFERFMLELKEFIVFSAPFVAYFAVAILYLVLLVIYKVYGQTYEVTWLTAILTVALVSVVAFFNLPGKEEPKEPNRLHRFLKGFQRAFADGTELAIFVFFLTMDSTKLFFLPSHLNIPLKAHIFGFDLMQMSLKQIHFDFTLTLIIIAVTSEILKAVIRILVVAFDQFEQIMKQPNPEEKNFKVYAIKTSIRSSFQSAKDDTLKFIAFTTFLLIVFLFFPRLKVFSMAIASLSTLTLDILIPSRLHAQKGTDLISRLIEKVFRL